MKCPRCQAENPPQAKFCEQCGTGLARSCSHCGSQLSSIARFCAECGHPVSSTAAERAGRLASPDSYTPKHLAEKILTSRAALEGEHKQVTVLFANLKGSMELLAHRDPEEARELLDPVLERMMEAVHQLPGTRARARRRRSTSPPRQRCTARWTCASGWSKPRGKGAVR